MVFLPKSVAKSFGELGPLMYCTRVSSALHLTDPISLRSIHLEASPAAASSGTHAPRAPASACCASGLRSDLP